MAGTGLSVKTSEKKKSSPEDLLRQIEGLREPIEKTLMDIREMISALDNPLIGVMDEPGPPPSRGSVSGGGQGLNGVGAGGREGGGLAPSRAGGVTEGGVQPPSVPQITLSRSSDVSRFNATALASLAVWLLGRATFERLVNSLALHSPENIYFTSLLREAADFVSATLREEHAHATRLAASHESYLLCVMLLELYISNPSQPSIGMVASLIQRLISGNGVRGV
ncbi:MAG: hypothetical protein QXH35_06990 [Nitrososphaerota archaeon]